MNKFLRVKWFIKRILSFPLKVFHPGCGGIKILMYHRVTDQVSTELAVSVGLFIRQMEYLALKARVISLEEAVKLLKKSEKLQDSYIVLTFDDGYEDIYTTVFPVLARLNLPATVFLPVGYISPRDKVFWWDKEIGYSKTLHLNHILEMGRTGLIDFQSHTIEHYDLDKVDRETLDSEICGSRDMLTGLLNREIKYFAYPRGIFTPQAVELAEKTYQAALTTIIGTNNIGANLHRLKRIPIERSDDLPLFKLKIEGKFEILYRLKKVRLFNWLWEKAKLWLGEKTAERNLL